MKNILMFLTVLVSGCTAFNGQFKYDGNSTMPTIREIVLHTPDAPRAIQSGSDKIQYKKDKISKLSVPNYWNTPVDKLAMLDNPLSSAINALVGCVYAFPSEFNVNVPAHTTQDLLFTTNSLHMYDKLCKIINYSLVK